MKKRLLSVALCAVLVLTLLPTALAATAPSVWIAGQELTSATPYYYNAGTVSAEDTGYNAYYNTETGVLTLNGLGVADSTATQMLSIEGNNITFSYAICAFGDLTINLISDSVVSTANAAEGNENIALGVNGNLTVTGSGTLTATAGNASGYSEGVDVEGDLMISGGTLTGIGSAAGSEAATYAESVGVGVMGDLTIASGSLTGTGGETTGNHAESYGVCVYDLLNVEGGTILATGGKAVASDGGSYSHGVGVFGGLTVTGGSLTADGGEAAVTSGGNAYAESYGIFAEVEEVRFSGGHVTATGGVAANDNSYGIINRGVYTASGTYSNGGRIAVSGTATVNVTGGAAPDSFGLFCKSSSNEPCLSVFNSANLTAAGGTASDDSYGIYAKTGDIELNGNEVTATGSIAADRSYGVFAEGAHGVIRVSGGEFTAKTISTSGTTMAALNKTLIRGPGVTAQGSTSGDGSSPADYEDAYNADYLWVYVPSIPALRVDSSASSVTVGGAVTLTAAPTNIADPTYQWYRNTAKETTNATAIDGATAQTYTPTTASAGTVYYYCVVNNTTRSNIVGVTVSARRVSASPTASQTVVSPETGDTGHLMLWSALLLISGGIVMTFGTAEGRRRKQHTK